MSSTFQGLQLKKQFYSEKEKKNYFYKVRKGLISTRRRKLPFDGKKKRVFTGCKKLTETYHRVIDNSVNNFILEYFLITEQDRSINKMISSMVSNFKDNLIVKSYQKRKGFELDNKLKNHFLLLYLYKRIHLLVLKYIVEGYNNINYKRIEGLKIKNNIKNTRLIEKIKIKIKKLEKNYNENNIFYGSEYIRFRDKL